MIVLWFFLTFIPFVTFLIAFFSKWILFFRELNNFFTEFNIPGQSSKRLFYKFLFNSSHYLFLFFCSSIFYVYSFWFFIPSVDYFRVFKNPWQLIPILIIWFCAAFYSIHRKKNIENESERSLLEIRNGISTAKIEKRRFTEKLKLFRPSVIIKPLIKIFFRVELVMHSLFIVDTIAIRLIFNKSVDWYIYGHFRSVLLTKIEAGLIESIKQMWLRILFIWIFILVLKIT